MGGRLVWRYTCVHIFWVERAYSLWGCSQRCRRLCAEQCPRLCQAYLFESRRHLGEQQNDHRLLGAEQMLAWRSICPRRNSGTDSTTTWIQPGTWELLSLSVASRPSMRATSWRSIRPRSRLPRGGEPQKHEARVFVMPSDIDISGDWEENVPVMKQLPLELCESGYADSCGDAGSAPCRNHRAQQPP